MAMSFWRSWVIKSFKTHIREIHGESWGNNFLPINLLGQIKDFRKDIFVGIGVLMRCISVSWWEWLGGSTLFFWGWIDNQINQARDGAKSYISCTLPIFKKNNISMSSLT